MKNALLLLLVGAAACSQPQEDPAPVPKPSPFTVGWRVENRPLIVDHWVSGTTTPATTILVYGREYVNGRIVSEVQLQVPAAVGTYPLSASSPAWATYARNPIRYFAGAAPGASASTGSGTIVLTSLQDRVAVGTFSFTGLDPVTQEAKEVTQGTFRVPL